MLIRPFQPTDRDYSAYVAIHNILWPDEATTVEYVRFRDGTLPPGYLFQRLLVEVAGKIVAAANYGETHWSYRPGKYDLRILVHPDHQNQGIGSKLYDHIIEALAQRDQPITMLTSLAQEDHPAALHFLTQRGFAPAMRFPNSALTVADFDPTPYADVVTNVAKRGIQIATLADLQQRDPKWQTKVWELDCTCTQDEPLPDAFTPPSLEQYIQYEFGAPGFLLEAWFLALDRQEHDRYVGMAVLYRDISNPQRLQAGFTGVRREYRRQGIALALKLQTIAFAQRYGAERIDTGNEENNPMFQINLRLGFQPKPAKVIYQKEVFPDS